MNVWGITDRGVIREQNQDAFAHQVLPDGRVLALVCDGMGGARAGNVASTIAAEGGRRLGQPPDLSAGRRGGELRRDGNHAGGRPGRWGGGPDPQ
mgnify:CR=1 FL=1